MEPQVQQNLVAIFPEESIKYREIGSGKKMAYIPYGLIVDRLNVAFGFTWSSHVNSIEKCGDEIIAVVSMNVSGVTKTDVGGATIAVYASTIWDKATKGYIQNPKAGELLPEAFTNAYKSAVSDGIKRCAMQFGVGNYLRTEDIDTAQPKSLQTPQAPKTEASPIEEFHPASDKQRDTLVKLSRYKSTPEELKSHMLSACEDPNLSSQVASNLIKTFNEHQRNQRAA